MILSGQFGLENIRPTMDNSRCFRFVFVRCYMIDMSSIYFIKVFKMIKVDLQIFSPPTFITGDLQTCRYLYMQINMQLKLLDIIKNSYFNLFIEKSIFFSLDFMEPIFSFKIKIPIEYRLNYQIFFKNCKILKYYKVPNR